MSDLIVPAVTAFVAVVTAFVAVLTLYHTLNDRRLRWQYDLFDRRWEIYAGVRDFLHGVSTSRAGSIAGLKAAEVLASDPSSPRGYESVLTLELAHQDLLRLMTKAHFLFERDVNEYLEELNTHCLALLEMERKQATTVGARLPDAWRGELKWFDEQGTTAKQKFEGYLRLTG